MKNFKNGFFAVVAIASLTAASVVSANTVVDNPVIKQTLCSKIGNIWGIRHINNYVIAPTCNTIRTYPKTTFVAAVIAAAAIAYVVSEVVSEDAEEAVYNN